LKRATPYFFQCIVVGILIIALAILFHAALTHAAVYDVVGPGKGIAPTPAKRPANSEILPKNPVLEVALTLVKLFGTRPYWEGPVVFPKSVPADEIDTIISHLIACESEGRDVDEIDSNGVMSYGILQYQDWPNWEKISGRSGSPDNTNDAINMARWAVAHGYLDHWSCSAILRITI
jgi:hypothetical protein